MLPGAASGYSPQSATAPSIAHCVKEDDMSRLLFTTLLITFAALTGCSGGGPPTAEDNTPAESIDVDLAGTWNGELIVNEA